MSCEWSVSHCPIFFCADDRLGWAANQMFSQCPLTITFMLFNFDSQLYLSGGMPEWALRQACRPTLAWWCLFVCRWWARMSCEITQHWHGDVSLRADDGPEWAVRSPNAGMVMSFCVQMTGQSELWDHPTLAWWCLFVCRWRARVSCETSAWASYCPTLTQWWRRATGPSCCCRSWLASWPPPTWWCTASPRCGVTWRPGFCTPTTRTSCRTTSGKKRGLPHTVESHGDLASAPQQQGQVGITTSGKKYVLPHSVASCGDLASAPRQQRWAAGQPQVAGPYSDCLCCSLFPRCGVTWRPGLCTPTTKTSCRTTLGKKWVLPNIVESHEDLASASGF